MSYEALRDFADTWGLLFLIALFLLMLVFIFRRGSTSEYRRAARIATDAPENLTSEDAASAPQAEAPATGPAEEAPAQAPADREKRGA